MKRAPPYRVRPIITLAADPAATEFFEIAKLVGAFRVRVHRCCVGGIVAGSRETSVPVKVRGDAMVVVDGSVLAWMPLRMTDTHSSQDLWKSNERGQRQISYWKLRLIKREAGKKTCDHNVHDGRTSS